MCIVLVLASLIPILSGYAIYLTVAALLTEASPALQVTAGIVALFITFLGLRLLWKSWAARGAAPHALNDAEPTDESG